MRYGIRCTLRNDDPLTASHLLGPGFESFYWYATAAERDHALAAKAAEHCFSRRGDAPTVVYAPIDADDPR
jgi:hypothetical protein